MSDVKILSSEEATAVEIWTFPEVKSSSTVEIDEKQKHEQDLLEQQKSQEILEIKIQEAIDKGYQDGFASGKQKALEEIQLQYEPLWQEKLQLLHQLLQEITTPLAMIDAELEQTLCDLVIKLTRHILRDELNSNPNQIIKLIKSSLELLPLANKTLRIYVNVQDKIILHDALSSEYAACLVDDVHMQRGECRFSSENSELDATLETRLAHLFNQVFHEGK